MAENKLDEGVQGNSNSPKTDPKLALLQDTWLESELVVLDLRARKRKGDIVGEALVAAKKRRNVLWKQLLGEWKKGWKCEREAKSIGEPAVPIEQGHEGEPEAQLGAHPGDPVQSAENVEIAGPEDEHELDEGVTVELKTHDAPPEAELDVPVKRDGEHDMYQPEQDESEDSDFNLDELEEVPEEFEEPDEPPRKKSRLEASQPEARPRSNQPSTKKKNASLTTQQKEHLRALICKTLGVRPPPFYEVESVAQAAGLTAAQVRNWVYLFYRDNPEPTRELALAWKSEDTSYRDILNEWLMAHRDNPYPSYVEKQRLAGETGKTLRQIDNWFAKARKKIGLTSNRSSPVPIAALGASFEENIYPNEEEKQRLARESGWFKIALEKRESTNNRFSPNKPGFSGNRFSPKQIALLSASFAKNIYPSAGEKERLAGETGLSLRQVKIWFVEKRKKQGVSRKRMTAEQKAPLRAWLHANLEHPWPSTDKKNELAEETGLTLVQETNWFERENRGQSRGSQYTQVTSKFAANNNIDGQ